MNRLGVWGIQQGAPKRIDESIIDLEKQLEDWIEKDPALVQEGLVVISRQLIFDGAGCKLDLLALDPQGTWVIIEIKRGQVMRETIAQAIDYASCLAAMSEEEITRKIDTKKLGHTASLQEMLKERDALDSLNPQNRNIAMILVGTGRAPELERMVRYLAEKHDLPLSVVTFHVFNTDDAHQLLIREITEPEVISFKSSSLGGHTVEDVTKTATGNGIGDSFVTLYDLALRHGLYPRVWKTSIMFTPPANRTRCLFTVWNSPASGKVKLFVAASAFVEFFQLPRERANKLLGEDGWLYLDETEVEEFVKKMDSLFSER
jgi:hypothetical protein